mmetsp:Transcript_47597/g.147159  ORF Transcript_47597/g.147159 Transcript_47597/m.147159 type:complete len:270 (+) Transcript_47597:1216-2025(+)
MVLPISPRFTHQRGSHASALSHHASGRASVKRVPRRTTLASRAQKTATAANPSQRPAEETPRTRRPPVGATDASASDASEAALAASRTATFNVFTQAYTDGLLTWEIQAMSRAQETIARTVTTRHPSLTWGRVYADQAIVAATLRTVMRKYGIGSTACGGFRNATCLHWPASRSRSSDFAASAVLHGLMRRPRRPSPSSASKASTLSSVFNTLVVLDCAPASSKSSVSFCPVPGFFAGSGSAVAWAWRRRTWKAGGDSSNGRRTLASWR